MNFVLASLTVLLLQVAAQNQTKGALLPPTVDSTCLGSPGHLGTSNMPFNSDGVATAIVDIHAYVPQESSSAALWVYRTNSNREWVQINLKWQARLKSALGNSAYSEIDVEGYPLSRGSVPVLVSTKQSELLRASLARAGMKLRPCFQSPLPKRYVR